MHYYPFRSVPIPWCQKDVFLNSLFSYIFSVMYLIVAIDLGGVPFWSIFFHPEGEFEYQICDLQFHKINLAYPRIGICNVFAVHMHPDCLY